MDEVEELIAKLKDADPKIRGDAARRLGVLRSFIAVPALVEALKDKNVNVRLNAAFAIEKMKEHRNAIYLMLGKDKNGKERYKLIDNLGIIRDPRAIPGLIEALNDMVSEVRECAANWLGQIGVLESIPGLIEAMKDQSSKVRGLAARSLKLILDKCKTTEQLNEFENKFDVASLRKGSKKSEVAFEIRKQISKLKNEIAKKRNSLSEDRGILLTEIPKPPKSGKGIYRAMRVIHNG